MTVGWRVNLIGVTSIVAAETRGKAIARTIRSATDAGYRVEWKEAKARRAPEYDGWAEVDASKHCWAERDVRNLARTPEVA